jgi:predicted metal-dependent hydrolase
LKDTFREQLRDAMRDDHHHDPAFLALVQARIAALEDEITLFQLQMHTLERRIMRRQQQLEALWRYQAIEEPRTCTSH